MLECVGVKIDSTMSMHDQINSITPKGYYYLHNFYRIADKLTRNLKVQLVMTYIIPLVDYCNVVLISATQCYIEKLQKLMNSAVRFIFRLNGKKRFSSITKYMKELHLLPVKFRMKYQLSLLVFKCINGLAPQYLCDLLCEKVGYSHLRSSNDLFLLHTNVPDSKYGESTFSYAASCEWNTLPSELKLCSSLETFKTLLKTHYFRLYYNV